MSRFVRVATAVMLATPLWAQSSLPACGPLPDSTSRQIIKVYGGIRVCLVATKVVGTEAELPHEWAARGAQVVMETQRTDDNRRASIAGDRVAWTINGKPAPIDSMTDRWQKSVLELLDASYEADALRAEAASLRQDIDSIPAHRLATEILIKSIERKQSQLNQAMLAVRQEESRYESQIRTLEMRRDDAQRRASAEERRAASTRDAQQRAAYEANARNYYAQAAEYERQISYLMRNARGSNAASQVATISEELRALGAEGNLALLRMKLANYDSTNVSDLEAQLTQLDAERRLPALDARVETARLALLAVLEGRGKAPSR